MTSAWRVLFRDRSCSSREWRFSTCTVSMASDSCNIQKCMYMCCSLPLLLVHSLQSWDPPSAPIALSWWKLQKKHTLYFSKKVFQTTYTLLFLVSCRVVDSSLSPPSSDPEMASIESNVLSDRLCAVPLDWHSLFLGLQWSCLVSLIHPLREQHELTPPLETRG